MELDADLIARARAGERAAVDAVVRETSDLVHRLALRMLGNPSDAEDATQEILVKIVRHLESFRGESAFRTWAYRVASNHLLTAKKRGAELRVENFEDMAERLDANLAAGDPAADDQILVREAKSICTSMMLACLDREHRLAYILGEIFEFSSEEAAAILEISSDAYRKRLSRARVTMTEFTSKSCGLVDAANKCRCARQAGHAVAAGYLDPARLSWGKLACRTEARPDRLDDLDRLSRTVAIFRNAPDYVAPAAIGAAVRDALDAGVSDLLR
jgi:RNA polymerase sigma factor (sigma-70 family)